MFMDILVDALLDSLKCVPFLLLVYLAIEFVEYKWGNRMGRAIAKAGAAGPAIGALAGSVPQCGISVMGAALYSQRMITIGTMLAVLLSTSDEAIPVILSHPESIGVLLPVLAVKIVIALVFGYAIDLAFRKRNQQVLAHLDAIEHEQDDHDHDHEHVLEEPGCCGHVAGAEHEQDGFDLKHFLLHPLEHTAKVFLFIFLVSLALGACMELLGTERIAAALSRFELLQPLVAALIGLIPNCAASVAITELYLQGVITFGALISGLCASGGLGILVLFKEAQDKREAFMIIGILLACSIIAGLVAGLAA
ncbi:MAG: arsenic efflux protein [Coriobacteriales bacterium]|nr:arsenic efflux protein [Coriobacteriales bacterium]MBQ6586804.1 arsenic efflux protein [Coriobacteriales bacterium]